MPKPPKHILVIRLSAMGDVAMTVPVLRAFAHQYPDVKITVLTRIFFTPLFRDLPNVTVVEADIKEKHKGIIGLYKLSKELKKLGVNAIADLHNVLRSKILNLFLFRVKCIQIDKGRVEKKALVSGERFEQLKTTHQRYADVFEKLGFKLELSNPSFPNPYSIDNFRIDFLKQNTWIGIAPFATYKSKMYPLDLMKEVIATLSKTYKILLFGGGQHEIEILNSLESDFDNTINLAGKLSLDEELDVISNLNVMLSMDSGNAHLAAMLGVKVITIWGVTHPFAGFAPFNQPKDYALLSDRSEYSKIPTSIYGNKYPDDYKEAARSIHPMTIIEKIESII